MVYYIEAVGADMLKIGFTDRDPEQRLKELQTGNPHKLRLVAYREGDTDDEELEHKQWATQRTSGEWFRIDHRLRWYMHWMEFGHLEVENILGTVDSVDSFHAMQHGDLKERIALLERTQSKLVSFVQQLFQKVDDVEVSLKVRESFATDRNRFADCRM